MKIRVIIAFLVANIIATSVASVFFSALLDRIEKILLHFTVGLIIAFLQSIVIGIPVLLLMKNFNIKGQFAFIFAGMLVAAIPWFGLISHTEFKFFISFAIAGGVGGYVYHWIVRERKSS